MGALQEFIQQKILNDKLPNPFFITEVRIGHTLRRIDSIAFSLDSLKQSSKSELLTVAHNENYCDWQPGLYPILNEISGEQLWLLEEKDSLFGADEEYRSVGQILTYDTLFKGVYPASKPKLGIICYGPSDYLENYQKEFLRTCTKFQIRVFSVLKNQEPE